MYGCLTFVMICRLLDSPHPTPILISYRLLRCSIPPRTYHPTSAETRKRVILHTKPNLNLLDGDISYCMRGKNGMTLLTKS